MCVMSTAFDRVCEAVGGMAKLARELEVPIQTVNNWSTRGIPVLSCATVEQLCGGAVMRWDMRPDDWHRIWPELIGTEGAPAITAEQTA